MISQSIILNIFTYTPTVCPVEGWTNEILVLETATRSKFCLCIYDLLLSYCKMLLNHLDCHFYFHKIKPIYRCCILFAREFTSFLFFKSHSDLRSCVPLQLLYFKTLHFSINFKTWKLIMLPPFPVTQLIVSICFILIWTDSILLKYMIIIFCNKHNGRK